MRGASIGIGELLRFVRCTEPRPGPSLTTMRSSKTHQRTLIALFEQRSDAERAITSLIGSGVRPEHIGYLQAIDIGEERNAAKGAAEGIAAGATSGAIIGGIIAAAMIGIVPGVGLALVAGALSGAFVGGLLGSEADSEEEPYFMQEVKSGRILVSVEGANDEGTASAVLRDSGALEVGSLRTASLHARLHHPVAS